MITKKQIEEIEEKKASLLGSQNARAFFLSRTLPLQAFVESDGGAMITTEIVEILDLEDTNDPVLAGEGLFQSVELRTFGWKLHTTDPVNGLPTRKE